MEASKRLIMFMNMKGIIFFLKNRIQSFGFAIHGFADILRTQHNARIHAFCTIIVLFFSYWLQIQTSEFMFIVFAIISVWICESFNTVLEIVIDIVSPQYSVPAKRAKDIAAAAVLIASLGAVVIGCVILLPPLLIKFNLGIK